MIDFKYSTHPRAFIDEIKFKISFKNQKTEFTLKFEISYIIN